MTWKKASRCATNACVEVNFKSACTYASDCVEVGFAPACASGACVEVAFHTACTAGPCVEVAHTDDRVLVRDSKDKEGPVLSFTHAEWTAFLGGCARGEFDLPS